MVASLREELSQPAFLGQRYQIEGVLAYSAFQLSNVSLVRQNQSKPAVSSSFDDRIYHKLTIMYSTILYFSYNFLMWWRGIPFEATAGMELVAVMCGGETGVKFADALAEFLGLRGNSTADGMENVGTSGSSRKPSRQPGSDLFARPVAPRGVRPAGGSQGHPGTVTRAVRAIRVVRVARV